MTPVEASPGTLAGEKPSFTALDQPGAAQLIRGPHGLDRRVITVGVIVPYFQRDSAILRRCLASIFAQKVMPFLRIHVLIVDDESPWPPEQELQGLEVPNQTTIAIIQRKNGGPSAARNSGLCHVGSVDFVAFIDSDDTWRDDHIQRAVDALGTSHDLYFSDHIQWGGFRYFGNKDFGRFLMTEQPLTSQPIPFVSDVRVFSSEELIGYAVNEFIAHISSIVYRTSTLANFRFEEELRWAGEDELFLLNLLFSSRYTCVSSEPEVELGLGTNLFRSSWSWDSESNLPRFACQVLAQVLIRRRFQLRTELYKAVSRRVRNWRPPLTFFIVRELIKRRKIPLSLLTRLVREDPIFLLSFPVNVIAFSVEWAVAKLRGEAAFDGERICR
jgi:succinoglycan biosynthesis protein ExoW